MRFLTTLAALGAVAILTGCAAKTPDAGSASANAPTRAASPPAAIAVKLPAELAGYKQYHSPVNSTPDDWGMALGLKDAFPTSATVASAGYIAESVNNLSKVFFVGVVIGDLTDHKSELEKGLKSLRSGQGHANLGLDASMDRMHVIASGDGTLMCGYANGGAGWTFPVCAWADAKIVGVVAVMDGLTLKQLESKIATMRSEATGAVLAP